MQTQLNEALVQLKLSSDRNYRSNINDTLMALKTKGLIFNPLANI